MEISAECRGDMICSQQRNVYGGIYQPQESEDR
jgi:hypothetical protein